jgi:hypothetical protein
MTEESAPRLHMHISPHFKEAAKVLSINSLPPPSQTSFNCDLIQAANLIELERIDGEFISPDLHLAFKVT